MRALFRARFSPALLLAGLLAGCAASPEYTGGHSGSGHFRIGRPNYTVSPYQVNGVWYYPKVDYSYNQTGTASWYGEQFNHRATSDGEIFDMNELSAAHKTLPLPSVVEVTNLQNGRALRLRVNDRGPFVGDRLIDLSRRAAQLLGFETAGTAPVRVQILKDDSIAVADAAMHGQYGPVGAGYATAGQAAPVTLAAASPPRAAPAMQMAAATPPSLRAAEVVAAPAPMQSAIPVVAPPEPARYKAPEPVAARYTPPYIAPAPVRIAAAASEPRRQPMPPEHLPFKFLAPPPARREIAAAPRRYWPSLIAPARAETLSPRFAEAPLHLHAAAKRSARIFVQAGAFAVPENARRVGARIATLGSVEIIPAASHGSGLYRVRLGPVGSTAEAERLLHKVVERGYPGARVVAE